MSDPVKLAKAAREHLAAALSAVQTDDDVPEELLEAAEPIAQAMSILHRIERTKGANLEGRDNALTAVRSALDRLQKVETMHPALDTVLEEVAASLSKVHALARYQAPVAEPQPAPVAQPMPAPVKPAPEPVPTPVVQPVPAPQIFATTQPIYPVQLAPVPEAIPAQPLFTAQPIAAVKPAPAPEAIPAPQPLFTAQPIAAVKPAPVPEAIPAPQVVAFTQPSPAAQPAFFAPAPAPTPEPSPAFVPSDYGASPLTQPSAPAVTPPPVAPTPAAVQPAVVQPPAKRSGPPAKGVVVVELGIHSSSNFYKGLGGNDVIEHGGIFVATYKTQKIGATVNLHLLLPGDYEFDATAVVQWTREGGSMEPGYGARFTQISQEGRQLVYRYTRNREPMFYDDL